MIAENLVDDNTKVITLVSGKGNETDELVIKPQLLLNATSEPILSIGNVHHEILPTDKKLTLSFGEDVALELTGRGNYGMKPKEVKIETDKSNSIFLTTEKDVKSYNIVLECYKETGFKEE